MLAGVYVMGFGVAFFLVGLTALVMFFAPQAKRTVGLFRSHARSSWFAAALLFSNFPAALCIMFTAEKIEHCYVLELHNESGLDIDSIRIDGGFREWRVGAMSKGESKTKWLWFGSGSDLVIIVRAGDTERSAVIDSYVSSHSGGFNAATINPGLRITALERGFNDDAPELEREPR